MANATVGGPKHYGSLYTTTQYTTDVKIINGSFMIVPANKLVVTISGNYSINEADFDPVVMPELSDSLQQVIDQEIAANNYDYSQMHAYSDLSYKRLDGSFKLNYKFSHRLDWSAEVIYLKFTDDNGYVYGNETGSLYIVRSGLEFSL